MIIIAVIMALVVGFIDALVKQMTSNVWDKGYLIAMFIYSVIVGLIAGYSGLIDLSAGLDQWIAVLGTVFTSYFMYLTMLHAVFDYIIAKIVPAQSQGLATPFMPPEKVAMLTPRK